MLETYRAAALPSRRRAAAWSELYSARLDRADFMPADQDRFDAELRLGNLGPIGVARLTCSRGAIHRDPAHIGHAQEPMHSFILQVQGSARFTHYGHEILLEEGDFTLCDSAAPHAYVVAQESELVMLRVPTRALKEHLPSPEHFCGRRLRGGEGLSESTAELVLSICAQLEAGLSAEFHNRVARNLLDMLATSFAVSFDGLIAASPVMCGRHARVKLYIEQHLRDPELSPAMIAATLKLSSRYLRMIFAATSETVSAYILRRRLEECAREMTDPGWKHLSITQIAFGWGFNSAPHFTRSFRDRFDVSPRNYRRRKLGEAADAGEAALPAD
ncbi:MAG: helix-turn-helix domain-containing protein [Sphingomonas sp.]